MIPDKRKRPAAYKWLARQMDLEKDECHIGLFDPAKCRTAIRIVTRKLKGETIMSNIPTKVVTGTVRLTYVHLVQAHANPQTPGAEPKFSATILIPKSDIATKTAIDAAIEAASVAGVNSKWNGMRPPLVANPVYDGDGVRPSDGMPFGDECKGHWVFTASTKTRPEVVDANLQPILVPTDIYSGMYARVSVNFFPYNFSGKKGIGVGLNNVQKLHDGEVLGGNRTSALDDFGGAAAPTTPPVQSYAPPAQAYAQPPVQGYAAPAQTYGQPSVQQPYAPPAQQYTAPPMQQPSYGAGYPAQGGYPPAAGVNPITGQPYQSA